MGTAFGLGMYLPLGIQIPMLVGGASRDIWEKKWLEPRVKANKWGEEMKTIKLLGTYMMATGLMVGEAVMGTIVALWFIRASRCLCPRKERSDGPRPTTVMAIRANREEALCLRLRQPTFQVAIAR